VQQRTRLENGSSSRRQLSPLESRSHLVLQERIHRAQPRGAPSWAAAGSYRSGKKKPHDYENIQELKGLGRGIPEGDKDEALCPELLQLRLRERPSRARRRKHLCSPRQMDGPAGWLNAAHVFTMSVLTGPDAARSNLFITG
jgi:hypothetical protein